MTNLWKKLFLLSALLILGLLLAAIPAIASASRQGAIHLPTPVPPEPYPNTDIYPAIVYLASPGDMQVLYHLRIDFEGVQPADGTRPAPSAPFEPSIATVYINPSQSSVLSQAGLTVIPIPNEGYRSFLANGPGSGAPNAWPTFDEYVTRMQALASAHPNIVSLVIIGHSVQGRGLYCMEITDNPGVDENEPEFKYTANHHGDETTGIEMTMRLAELLGNSYGADPNLTALVDGMEIWLCPIYNPDGYVAGTRYNAHNVDLNRDFPDRFTDPIDDPAGREPETQAFMLFGYAHRFVMGANYHGGAQVLNYPWDAVSGPPYYAPDDQLFFDLGYGYTSRNTDLLNGGFPDGMTRGWEWYMIYGGMQDWAYLYRGEHHVTLEISDTKSPPYTQMDTFWDHNQASMVWWMSQSLTGFSGLVLDARDNTPLNAIVTVNSMAQPNFARTDPDVGDYHRVISPGNYTLTASANCYQTQFADVSILTGTATVQDFYLNPLPDFSHSTKEASVYQAPPEDIVDYQLRLENTCIGTTVSVTDTLPPQVTWTGYLSATQGTPTFEAGQILWQGEVSQSQAVTITYAVSLNQCLLAGISILNTAELDDGVTSIITRTAQVTVTNVAPSIPTSPTPLDDAVDQPFNTPLSWAASTDLNCDSITYDIAFGTSPTPPVVATGLTIPSYTPGTLLPETTYYWFVIAHDGLAQTHGPTWSFTTSTLKIFLPIAIK